MKKVAGGLRLDLAAFRELEAFAQLGTDLDAATQARLDRGYRMVEILKQGQYVPMHVVDQVLIIYAASGGHLDQVPIPEVKSWEEKFLTFMRDQKSEVRDAINEKQDLDDQLTSQIDASIAEFKTQYETESSAPAASNATTEPALV